MDLWRNDALELAESNGFFVNAEASEFGQLCRALNDAGIEAGKAAHRRLEDGGASPRAKEID